MKVVLAAVTRERKFGNLVRCMWKRSWKQREQKAQNRGLVVESLWASEAWLTEVLGTAV